MKLYVISTLMAVWAFMPLNSWGQAMDKKYATMEVSRELPVEAARVWQAVAEDYGEIANSHPKIWYSGYEAGSLKGELGAQRRCDFNEKGSRVLHEQIVGFDVANMTMTNRVLEAAGFPLDPENAQAIYSVEELGEGKSKVSILFHFRTKPSFLGPMMKGQFKGLLNDYLIALEHYLSTGEVVNAKTDNFQTIKTLYL